MDTIEYAVQVVTSGDGCDGNICLNYDTQKEFWTTSVEDIVKFKLEKESKHGYHATYKIISRIKENMNEITSDSLHELLDRSFMVADMFESYIVEHPASESVKEEVFLVRDKLWDLYQVIGKVAFDKFEEEAKQAVFIKNHTNNYTHSMRLEGLE